MTVKTRGDKRKVSIYIPNEMREAMEQECIRQDRSLSWLIQKSWKVALPTVQQFPGVQGGEG